MDDPDTQMKRKLLAAGALLLALAFSACSSEELKRAAYEAAYQKGCMDRSAMPNCDPAHPSYDEYKRARLSP